MGPFASFPRSSLSLFYMLWLNDPVLHAVSRLLLLLRILVLLSF